MVAKLEDYLLDNGLNVLDTSATHIMICAGEPSDYSTSSVGAANVLGMKSFGAGGCFGSPGAGSPNGRTVTSISVTDGTITAGGTASWWAVIDSANSRFLAHGSLSATQVVSSGNTFTLGLFTVRIPSNA